jgi:hypothetical protein
VPPTTTTPIGPNLRGSPAIVAVTVVIVDAQLVGRRGRRRRSCSR